MWCNCPTELLEKFCAPVFATNIPEVGERIALRCVFEVPAYLAVFKHANMVLVLEALHSAHTHDLAVIFPRDAMIGVPFLDKERNKLLGREMLCDCTEQVGLPTTIFDEREREHAVAYFRVVRRIEIPEVVLDAMHQRIRIHHLRAWELFYKRTTIMIMGHHMVLASHSIRRELPSNELVE